MTTNTAIDLSLPTDDPTLPAMAVVHAMEPADRADLAARWARDRGLLGAVLADPATVEQARRFDVLGSAAARLERVAREERRTTTCPACAFDGLAGPPYLAFEEWADDGDATPPYAVAFGDPSRTRCPCCGYGFGFDDVASADRPAVTFTEWRAHWLASGGRWQDEATRPAGFDARAQLASAGRASRGLSPGGS